MGLSQKKELPNHWFPESYTTYSLLRSSILGTPAVALKRRRRSRFIHHESSCISLSSWWKSTVDGHHFYQFWLFFPSVSPLFTNVLHFSWPLKLLGAPGVGPGSPATSSRDGPGVSRRPKASARRCSLCCDTGGFGTQ